MDKTDRLIAIEDIKQLKARYFRAMDTKDWDLFRSLFVEDAVVDTTYAFVPTDFQGNPIEANLPPAKPEPSYLIHGIAGFMEAQLHNLTGVSTVHHGHTPEIEIVADDEATGIWAMEDKLRWPNGRTMHGYGHYTERYRKVDGKWRIASLRLTRVRIDLAEGK